MAFRENNDLQRPQRIHWSGWVLAMVPAENENNRRNLEIRGQGQVGYRKSTIRDALGEACSYNCGIYEWKATRNDQRDKVVYVGSTCPRGGPCPRLKKRIIGYCTNGSHKEDLINNALRDGYELWVRYKVAANVEEAKRLENELLAMYDYAWNIRNNGHIRNHVLPSL